MKEPVDHILRPQLPWRTDAGITECGHDAARVPTITRDEWLKRLKEMGARRTTILTCMTCSDTAKRWGTWEDDPRKAVGREVQWESAWREDRGDRLRVELLAIAALIDTHRDEFDATIANIEQRREWNEKKAANLAAKTQTRHNPSGGLL